MVDCTAVAQVKGGVMARSGWRSRVSVLLAVLLAVSCSSASEGGGTGDQPGDERTGEAPPTAETLPFDPRPSGLDAANADERNPYGWFEADRSWWGDFGDPFVLRDGDTYVAYGS